MDAALKRPQLVDLSEGVMVYLFSFLAPADLGPVALTCRRFKAVRTLVAAALCVWIPRSTLTPVNHVFGSVRPWTTKSCGSCCFSAPTAQAACSYPNTSPSLTLVPSCPPYSPVGHKLTLKGIFL
jgi:hypothetical protein